MPDNHYGCYSVMTNLRKIIESLGKVEIIFTVPVGKRNWHTNTEIISYIKTADIIIVNGEGSVHHSNENAKSVSFIARFVKSISQNKICILLNTTLFANDKSIYDNISYFDLVYVRDQYSVDELQKFGIMGKKTPDFTFYNDYSISEELLPSSSNSNNNVAVGESVVLEASNILKHYREQNNYTFLNIFYSAGKEDLDTHINEMRNFKYIITGRFHTVCFCINAKIPFIALESNTNKISNLLLDVFGSNNRLLNSNDLSIANLEQYIKFTNDEITQINIYKKQSNHLFHNLKLDLKDIIWK